MYLFRLAPVSVYPEDWQSIDAFFTEQINDYDWFNIPHYDGSPTGINEQVVKRPYVYTSVVEGNVSDPAQNYIGRVVPLLSTVGNDSWVRSRMMSRYSAINRFRSEYSWNVSGDMNIMLRLKEIMPQQDADNFYGNSIGDLYAIFTDIIGSEVTVRVFNSTTSQAPNQGTVLYSETVSIPTSPNAEADWTLNPEVPGISKNTLIRNIDMSSGATVVSITIKPPSSGIVRRAALSGFYIGRATKIGHTQQDKLSFDFNDGRRLIEDEYGHISLTRSRVTRKISAEIFTKGSNSEDTFKLLQHVRATPSFFLFVNDINKIVAQGKLSSGLLGMIGLLKTVDVKRDNTQQAFISLSVDSLPTLFDDPMYSESISVCGVTTV